MWCKNKLIHVMQEQNDACDARNFFFFWYMDGHSSHLPWLNHGCKIKYLHLIDLQTQLTRPKPDSTRPFCHVYMWVYITCSCHLQLSPQVCHICNEPSRHDALPNLDHFQGVFIYYIPQLMMRSYTPWTQFSFLLFIFWNELHLTNWSHFWFLYKIEILL